MSPRKHKRSGSSGDALERSGTVGKRKAKRSAAWVLLLAVVVGVLGVTAWMAWPAQGATDGSVRAEDPRSPAGPPAEFVGASACASCHTEQYQDWKKSQHSVAMQEAGEETVLGDFSDVRFTYAGVTTTFFRRDDAFMVRTDGPDGELDDFEVKYTFGVDPLQQYLIELPGGRLQALSIAWDARPASEGGQRWFHLYPGEAIRHLDELHWTRPQFNWNFMCADCHSTNVRKNYDAASDHFQTTWSEVNVACEACHGPGSRHLEWAERPSRLRSAEADDLGLTVRLNEREGVHWSSDPATGKPRRSAPRTTDVEVQVCAQCHSRRAQIADGYTAGKPFLDHYLPSLLMPGLYHPDGQQQEEVYTYGSFLQSKMYRAGVTCSNCHNPHSGKLKADGNALCGQCHTPADYDTVTHTFHQAGSAGAQCVSCHMPATTYMVVDPRRDHSFRVPRPDLSVEMGVPNACTDCHEKRTADWAAERVREWYGQDPTGFQRFARAFHADERDEPGAASGLLSIAADPSHPSLARASSLERLADTPSRAVLEAVRVGLSDADPLVRRAALTVLETVPPRERVALAGAALHDSVRVVRLHAAWVLAPAASALPTPALQSAFARAADEFIASQRYNADRPESRITLGTFLALLGRFSDAEDELKAALRLDPRSVPAHINLADLYRAQGRETEAQSLLRSALETLPEEPALHHALALSLVRTGDVPQALEGLERAADLAPEQPRFAYAFGVALHSSGREEEAIRTLENALASHPRERDLLFALTTFHRDAGRPQVAVRYAERLVQAFPEDPQARTLLASLKSPVRTDSR